MNSVDWLRLGATLGIFAVLAGGVGWLASKSRDSKAARKEDSEDVRAEDTRDR